LERQSCPEGGAGAEKEEAIRQRQAEDAALVKRKAELEREKFFTIDAKIRVVRENMRDRIPVVLDLYAMKPDKPQSQQQLVESRGLCTTWRGLYFLRDKADNIDLVVLDQAAHMLLTTPDRLLSEDFDPEHTPIDPDGRPELVSSLNVTLQVVVAAYDDREVLCKQLRKCLRTRRVSGKVDQEAFYSARDAWSRIPKSLVVCGPDLSVALLTSNGQPMFDAEDVERVERFLFVYQPYLGELHRQLRRRLRLGIQRSVRLRTLLEVAFVVGVEPEEIIGGTAFG
jgi:hypothetical protein